MPLAAQVDMQGELPLFEYGPAPKRAVNLGVGGPYGVGGAYPQGALLGCVTTAAQSEVVTHTVSGSPTGTKITLTYTADKVYVATTANAVSAHASLAQVQAAYESIFGSGNVAVTGTPGTSYVVTFQAGMANTRVNGLLAASAAFTAGTSPAITCTRTTRGSCGTAQYELYDGSSGDTNEVDAVLAWDFTSDPTGARVQYPGRTAVGQPSQPVAYWGGYFDPTTLSMFTTPSFGSVDSNAYTLGKLLKKAGGAVVRLL